MIGLDDVTLPTEDEDPDDIGVNQAADFGLPLALFIDGFLMEVRDLVNGTSIAPATPPDMETIEYFQIVLSTQEVIWAEGAPVETFGARGKS